MRRLVYESTLRPMFTIKKILGVVLLPLPILLCLLAIGVAFSWSKARSRGGRLLVTFTAIALAFLSFKPIPLMLGRQLEMRYPLYAYDAAGTAPSLIVVLGGGAGDDPAIPASSRLGPTTLARLVEGIRIATLHPESQVIVSGGRVFTRMSEAESMAEAARTLGVSDERIIVEPDSRDTEEQAQRLREVIGRRRFVLVTSALHMPRTVALFRRQGLEPIPAPTDHRFGTSFMTGPRAYLPSAEPLRAMESVAHEYYGFAWSWARGRL